MNIRAFRHLLRRAERPTPDDDGPFFRTLVEAGELNVLVVGVEREVRYASPACIAMLGADPTGARCETLVSDEVLVHLNRLLRAAFDGQPPPPTPQEFGYRIPGGAAGGSLVRVRFGSLLHLPAVRGVMLSFVDVSEAHQRTTELARIAFVDTLTGLPNRMIFIDRLETALRTHARGTVALADVDLFRPFNDAHGQPEGDRLLQRVGRRLVAALPAAATVARVGDDDFGILLPGLAMHEAEPLLRQAAAAVAVPFALADGTPTVVTVSIGAVTAQGRIAENVLKQCDAAMHAAKARGRNQLVVFDDQVRKVIDGHRTLASALADLQERNRALHDEARTDALTGLRNRLALDAELDRAPGGAGEAWASTGLAFVDIDHFGSFNKLHSDAAGDEALRRIAQALQGCSRDTDLLFRKGGEELVVLLPNVDHAAAVVAAERLRATVAALAIPHRGSATAPVLTVTVGVACGAGGGSVRELLHQAAELAMQAKLSGRRNMVHAGPVTALRPQLPPPATQRA